MALINKDKKYIFFHLYKCGGSSVRTLLRNTIEGNEELLKGHCIPRDLESHFEKRGNKEMFDSMFKFTIVRNPFDFLLSLYNHAKRNKIHFWHKEVKSIPFSLFPKYYITKIDYLNKSIVNGSNKIITPYEFIRNSGGNVIVDFVGKLENINRDMNFILNAIGEKPMALPKINVNNINKKPYREVYDAKTRDFVEKNFKKDLEYFEYEF